MVTRSGPDAALTAPGLTPGVTQMRPKATMPSGCMSCDVRLPCPGERSPEHRLWSRIRIEGECWVWTGHRLPRGYGKIRWNGTEVYVHRLAYTLVVGPLQDGQLACHHCDNPPCVSADADPDVSHLFAGSNADNLADAAQKGRMRSGDQHGLRLHPEAVRAPRGERNGTARLTEDQVREIRTRYAAGGVSIPKLSQEFGVSRTQIHSIIHRRKWAHVQ